MISLRPAALTVSLALALFPAAGDTQQSGSRQSDAPAYTVQAVHRPAAEIPHLDRILPAGQRPQTEATTSGESVVNTVVVTSGQPSARYVPPPAARAAAPLPTPAPAPRRTSMIEPTTRIPEDAPPPPPPTATVRATVPTAPATSSLPAMSTTTLPAMSTTTAVSTGRTAALQAAVPQPVAQPLATPAAASQAAASQAAVAPRETGLGKPSATAQQRPGHAVAPSTPVVAADSAPPGRAVQQAAAAQPVAAQEKRAVTPASPSRAPAIPATRAPAPETAVVAAAPAAPPIVVVKSHPIRVLRPVPASANAASTKAAPMAKPAPVVAQATPEVVEKQYRSSTSMFAITPDGPTAHATAPVQVGLGRPKDNPYAPQTTDDADGATIDLGRPTTNPYAPQPVVSGHPQEPNAFANGQEWLKRPVGPKKTVPKVQKPGLTSSRASNNNVLAASATPISGISVSHVGDNPTLAGATPVAGMNVTHAEVVTSAYSAPSSFPGVRTSVPNAAPATAATPMAPAETYAPPVVQPTPEPRPESRPEPIPQAAMPELKPLQAMPYSPSLDLTSLDKSIDPCVDFYQYSCGGWQRNNPIPADQSSWSVYAKLGNENEQFLWGILQDDAKPSATRTPVQQKIGDYFAACMNTPEIDHEAESPILPALGRIAAIQSRDEVFTAIPLLQRTMLGSYFYNAGTGQDARNAALIIVEVNAGGLGLPDRDYYLKQDPRSVTIRKQYSGYVQQMFALVGENPDLAAANADSVLRIETALAQASLTRVQRRDPHMTYHMMDLEQLRKLVPSIDWLTYFSLQGATQLDRINVSQPAFLTAVQTELTNEPIDALKAYLAFHALTASAPYLARPYAEANFQFYSTTLRGVPAMPPRWKTCTRAVDRNLGEALGQEFVARTFSADTKAKTQVMTEQIEAAMQQEIEGLDWMSPATKAEALRKLHAIRNKIGYPDKWRDYSGLQVKRDDYFGNVLRSARFEEYREWHKLGKPVDKNEWGMTPPTVNAYFNPQMNDINFPAGVLQPPLYDPKMDNAPNYGNTGATIGHELTHAFDDEGRQFDAQGNLRDWWTPTDAKGFEDRIDCDRNQYAGYTVVDDIHINSKLTSGEDVADLGGTLLAYMAWKKQTAGHALGDVDGFTPDQRFFVGMAQWACENVRPEDLRLHAATDPHSPGFARINGVVSNMPEFQQAFGCKAGQPMVHAPVCKVW